VAFELLLELACLSSRETSLSNGYVAVRGDEAGRWRNLNHLVIFILVCVGSRRGRGRFTLALGHRPRLVREELSDDTRSEDEACRAAEIRYDPSPSEHLVVVRSEAGTWLLNKDRRPSWYRRIAC
jgi:hypothetical protein